MDSDAIRIGIAGLGRGFMLMLPTFAHHPKVKVVAAAAPGIGSRRRFEETFGGTAYASVEEMCADPTVEVVYIATPHEMHVEHTHIAASAGKHVLVEKPMALSVQDCRAMIKAAEDAGVHLLVGHSHSFDAPYLRARALIKSGSFGQVRMINALNFTDFLYRPRRPEELDTKQGGGVLFSQAPHQIDIVRMLAQSEVRSVRAITGIWDPTRPTEGAYMALLTFTDGASASLTYNGYAHLDSDEFMNWVGEMGNQRSPDEYGKARRLLKTVSTPDEEAALKSKRTFTNSEPGPILLPRMEGYNHFGLFIVSCDKADLRPLPSGVAIYADENCTVEKLPDVVVPRSEVIDELYEVVRRGQAPLHSGNSGMMTMAVCHAIKKSAEERREVMIEEVLHIE